MKIRNWFALDLLAIVLGGLAIGGWLIWSAIGESSLPGEAFMLLGLAVLALLIDARNEERAQAPSESVDALEQGKGEAPTCSPSAFDRPADSTRTGP